MYMLTSDCRIGSCLEKYLADQQAGWMVWGLAGSYFIREGTQDGDEPWGLLTHDWSTWRSPEHINGSLVGLIQATVAVNGTVQGDGANSTGNGTTKNSGGYSRSGGKTGALSVALTLWLYLIGGIFFV
jgi:hypothetical protein